MVEQPNQFKCHSCGRSFSSEDQLREHEKTAPVLAPTAASKRDLIALLEVSILRE